MKSRTCRWYKSFISGFEAAWRLIVGPRVTSELLSDHQLRRLSSVRWRVNGGIEEKEEKEWVYSFCTATRIAVTGYSHAVVVIFARAALHPQADLTYSCVPCGCRRNGVVLFSFNACRLGIELIVWAVNHLWGKSVTKYLFLVGYISVWNTHDGLERHAYRSRTSSDHEPTKAQICTPKVPASAIDLARCGRTGRVDPSGNYLAVPLSAFGGDEVR
ncbi:hypothetical protein C8R44DRAFT_752585 [Mycena epipterygia]|nr:hypothetical protein C8R44DRAFT_752585 [Mycena epipterygia]